MIGPALLYRSRCLAGRCLAANTRNVWTSPLSKLVFSKKKQHRAPHPILEQAPTETSPAEARLIADLKHYLRTGDIPNKLRQKILAKKILDIANWPDQYSPALIESIDNIFNTVYSLHNKDIDAFLALNEQILLFSNSVKLLGLLLDRKHFPQYAYLLIQNLLHQSAHEVPIDVLVQMVELGAVTRGAQVLLQALLLSYGLKLTPAFSRCLIEAQQTSASLSLTTFKLLASNLSQYDLVDKHVVLAFKAHIEALFSAEPPRVHEYEDCDRNLDSIMHVASDFLTAKSLSIPTCLHLMKLIHDLLAANNNPECQNALTELKDKCFTSSDKIVWEHITREIFAQPLDDEELVETILLLVWSDLKYQAFANKLCDFVKLNDVKFSHALRAQAQIYQLASSPHTTEGQATENVLLLLNECSGEEGFDPNTMFLRTIQCAMATNKFSPQGHYVSTISGHFNKAFEIESSIEVYKTLLDAAIAQRNYTEALKIFEDSALRYVEWSKERDPAVLKTLNDLIVLTCDSTGDLGHIFPVFMKIKLQMSEPQCNAESITALATRLLEAEYVGDLIEMLKRELPQIGTDTRPKLPVSGPAGIKYCQLFQTLHDFIVSYTGESTHETNWVLYGELHKYFEVPFDSYLPAMKYFCQHDRANAALIIFRQVRKLHELHGHQFEAPLRDMYLYLLQQFGDKLYEDGVIEVHEHLKTDIMLPQQDIQLQNAILNAYSNLQDVPRARDLFLAMSAKPKLLGGVNEETVQIMIKTYTYTDLGYVKHFWNNLSQFNIVPNLAIYQQYVIAHVYHGLADEAIGLIEEMDDYGLTPTSTLLTAAHNFCFDKKGQKTIAEWCEKTHPQLWEEAVNSGSLIGATNYMPSQNMIAGSTIE